MVDTLKTAVVVVLLLAVLYGVYVVLNKPEQYPQDLAWETGAADPALQIELGIPESGDPSTVSTDSALPDGSWGSTSRTDDQVAGSPTNQGTQGSGTIEQDNADHQELDGHNSLPIPEPTTPAAPDLLGANERPTTGANEFPPMDVSFVPEESSEATAAPFGSATSNSLREPAGGSSSIPSPANRFGESNRYSGHSSLRDEPAMEQAGDNAPPPATSTQANVNDVGADQTSGVGMNAFQSAMQSVHAKIEAEAWYDALLKLSSHFNDPTLSADEYTQLVDLLDPLAGRVIYSTAHLVEPAYQSQPGDTLKNIADRYELPWQLLANINGIENPETLLTGRELKVLRGPFRVEVSLSKNELTLFVGKLYAGRFAITVGSDPAPLPGQYQVNDKQPGRTYYAGNGQTIPIDDPNNPYGRVWLDLGSSLSIHGSSPNGTSRGQGCIALTARDANDVYGILSKGSSVVIVR